MFHVRIFGKLRQTQKTFTNKHLRQHPSFLATPLYSSFLALVSKMSLSFLYIESITNQCSHRCFLSLVRLSVVTCWKKPPASHNTFLKCISNPAPPHPPPHTHTYKCGLGNLRLNQAKRVIFICCALLLHLSWLRPFLLPPPPAPRSCLPPPPHCGRWGNISIVYVED